MKTHVSSLITVILFSSHLYAVSPDSTDNELSVQIFLSYGRGSLHRDERYPAFSFFDYAGGAEMKYDWLVVGVQGGEYKISGISTDQNNPETGGYFSEGNGSFVSVYAGFSARYGSLLAGAIFPKEQLQVHFKNHEPLGNADPIIFNNRLMLSLRIGSEDGWYASGEWFKGAQVISGGGSFKVGAGYSIDAENEFKIWTGAGAVDKKNTTFIMTVSRRVSESYYLSSTAGYDIKNNTTMISVTCAKKFRF